jgi:hypothetical protein
MRLAIATLSLTLAALGCSDIAGVGDFAVGDTGAPTGATTSAGGAGGAGGSATGGNGGVGGGVSSCVVPFVDDFENGEIDLSRWDWIRLGNQEALVLQSGGVLRFRVLASTGQRGIAMWSLGPFDIRGCTVHVQLVKPIAAYGGSAVFSVGPPGYPESAGFEAVTVGISFNGNQGGIVYDPTQPIWLRIREVDGELALDTSADGKVWNERHRSTPPFALNNLEVRLGAYAWDFFEQGSVVFDNLNAPPP